MAYLNAVKFSFVSQALAEDTFGVVKFDGVEGLNQCYRFEIDLVSDQADVNLDQILQHPAAFTIKREGGDIPFHGILASFEQLHQFNEYTFYRAVLAPKLWWLSLTHHNQVFLEKSIAEVFKAVLEDGGLSDLDFELRLQENYPTWEYLCQYRESHYDFIARWLERDGIYYYFEQNENGEKAIFTDTHLAHTDMPQGRTMSYSPPSGLESLHEEEIMRAFTCRQQMLPKEVLLKDYNYRTPSLEISGKAQVKNGGRGQVYVYGEHFRTPEEGNTLAKIRAEELLCREKVYLGESGIPFLRPGYTFALQDHYREDFNQKYLTIELHHRGSQAAYLVSGIKQGLSEIEEQPFYQNSFQAIPAGVQFRPEHQTEKARLYGTMNAKIDASGTGKYAELDDQGRYKVILPFDLSGRKDGKASAFLRMMQPYAGSDHGIHFPLHKGAEVLLTFIDGDPDRPVIAGAVPNPINPSQVNQESQTMSKITTGGQNKIHIEDKEGSERILMQSPNTNSWMRMGAPNDPEGMEGWKHDEDGFVWSTEGSWNQKVHQKMSIEVGGNSTTIVVGGEEVIVAGFDNKTYGGLKTDIVAGVQLGLNLALNKEWHPAKIKAFEEKLHMGEDTSELHELRTMIADTNQFIVQEATRLGETLNRIAGEVTAICDTKIDMADEATFVSAQALQMMQSEEVLAEDRTALAETITTLVQSKNNLAEEYALLAETINMLGSELSAVVESFTVVAGEATIVSGETTII